MELQINISGKVARAAEDYEIICGNNDYTIKFTFDSEWAEHLLKTACFKYISHNGQEHTIKIPFVGDVCEVPMLSNTNRVGIGVFAGDLDTTTPCVIGCRKPIIYDTDLPENPPDNVYTYLTGLYEEGVETVKRMESNVDAAHSKAITDIENACETVLEDISDIKNESVTDIEESRDAAIARVAQEADDLLSNKANKDHAHNLAGPVDETVSLNGITTYSGTSGHCKITDNTLTNYAITKETFTVDIQGKVNIAIAAEMYGVTLYVDGVTVDYAEDLNDLFLKYSGEVKENIQVSIPAKQNVTFATFTVQTPKNGFVTPKQVEKLESINLTADDEAVNTVLQNFENGSETAPAWNGVNNTMEEWAMTGKSNGDDANVITKTADGKIIAGALGANSAAFNGKGQAKGGKSFVAGSKNVALGSNAFATGNGTFAAGQHSFTSGNGTTALGNSSFAIGGGTIAEGKNSLAMGDRTKATGKNAFSSGMLTEANGENSLAVGDNSKAKGTMSVAEGYETESAGFASHSLGGRTKATGAYAVSEGFETVAKSDYQHVSGRANIEDDSCKYLHIVGNGTINDDYSVKERRNAHTIDWDGNAWFAGRVKIGGTGQDDKNAKVLATLDDVSASANAVKAYASGETIRVDDVSPIEHVTKAKVSGKNLIPAFTGARVRSHANITQTCYSGGQSITLNGTASEDGGGRTSFKIVCLPFEIKKGKTYTLSHKLIGGSVEGLYHLYLSNYDTDVSMHAVISNTSYKTFTADVDCRCYIGINIIGGSKYTNAEIVFMLEEGTEATAYEPYVDPTTVIVTANGKTYKPGADGKIDIVSVYPAMTISTNTAGVNIELEYNQDANKVINNLRADLKTLENTITELTNLVTSVLAKSES